MTRSIRISRVSVMLEAFYPYEYAKSVFSIDYEKLYQKGFRGVIFDIDMTLVPHGEDITPEVKSLFDEIHSVGLKTMLLTNNDEERTRRFVKDLDIPYIFDAEKPEPKNYLEAVKRLNISPAEAVYIGDQLFIDVYGANRSGIASILVKYILMPGETKLGVRRRVEALVLWLWSLKGKRRHRLGDIMKSEGFR